jgi:hypothetical protein
VKSFNADWCFDCGLTVDDIEDDEFSCRGGLAQHIIYRAIIGGNEQYNSRALVSLIHSWVVTGSASINVLSHRLHLDKDCNTLLIDLNEPDCPLQPDTESRNEEGSNNAGELSSFLIGAIIFSVLILVLILVITIIILKIYSKRRERYDLLD